MPAFTTFASESHYVDPHYGGNPRFIAVGVLETDAGLALVDPGPEVSLDGLRKGLRAGGFDLDDVSHILLTHIHLDHAGATGRIAREVEDAHIYVHEKGAPHMAHPERLLQSARRIYGDEMEQLWGEMQPIPSSQITAIAGGERIDVGGRPFRVLYTPGHAQHHVSYVDERTETAFVGDVAGQKTVGIPFILPVTPPPDVEVEQWYESIVQLRAVQPKRLFLTHFGPSSNPEQHLDEMQQKLEVWAVDVRDSLSDDQADDARAQAFEEKQRAKLQDALSEEDRYPYEVFGDPAGSWYGLARYWRKAD